MIKTFTRIVISSFILISQFFSPINTHSKPVQAAPLGVQSINDPWYMHKNVSPPFPYSDTGNNVDDTTVTSDPYFSCIGPTNQGLGSVWYRYTPVSNGTITIDTFGSTTDTVLGVWQPPAGMDPQDPSDWSSFTVVPADSCNDDYDILTHGTDSQVEFQVNSGDVLFIEVATARNGQGTYTINVNFTDGSTPTSTETATSTPTETPTPTETATSTLVPTATPAILYVKPVGLGSKDCSDWENACILQFALTNANSGDEIWAAAGKYTPGDQITDTFRLRNGVAIYGGFYGNEITRNDRDLAANVTVLSGDINNNDSQSPIITDIDTVTGNNDNSLHVVRGATGAILDGFTITAGYAIGPNPLDKGAGMYNQENNPTIRNVEFRGNYSDDFAGGMYNDCSDPILINVTFNDNKAQNYGGGMANRFSSNPSLVNVTFFKNSSFWNGGGMLNDDNSNPTLTNTTFIGNSSGTGGGIHNDNSAPNIYNSIIWGNVASIGAQINNSSSTTTISDSVIQDGCPDGSTCSNIISTDPLLGSIGLNGGNTLTLPLLTGSSAIDALVTGTNGCGTTITTDQRGMSRPQGTACDIGAFEVEAESPPTPTSTFTETPTLIPTDTETATLIPTDTETATLIPTDTETSTTVPSDTATVTPVPTGTETATFEPSLTYTPTFTSTETTSPSATNTYSPTNTTFPTSTLGPTLTPPPLYAYKLVQTGYYGSQTLANCRVLGYASKVSGSTGTVYIRIYLDDILVAGKYTAKGGGINFDLLTLAGNPFTINVAHNVKLMAILENSLPYYLINSSTGVPGGTITCSDTIATATPVNTSIPPSSTPVGPTATPVTPTAVPPTATTAPSSTPGGPTATPRPIYVYNLVQTGNYGSQTLSTCRVLGYASKVSGGTGTVYIRIYLDDLLVAGKYTATGGGINFDLLTLPGNPFTINVAHNIKLMAILENSLPYYLINSSTGVPGGTITCSDTATTATPVNTSVPASSTPVGPSATPVTPTAVPPTATTAPSSTPGGPTATPRPLYAYNLVQTGNYGSQNLNNCRVIGYASKLSGGTGTVYIRIYLDEILVAGKYTAKGGEINFDLLTLPGNPFTTGILHNVKLMAFLENGQPYYLINSSTHEPGGLLTCE